MNVVNKKQPEKIASKPVQAAATSPAPVKKKLSLDVSDVSEVLERKISP
jgi:hypothetical protein